MIDALERSVHLTYIVLQNLPCFRAQGSGESSEGLLHFANVRRSSYAVLWFLMRFPKWSTSGRFGRVALKMFRGVGF